MWIQQVRRRREALRLVRTIGSEVTDDFGKSRLRQLIEVGLLGLRGYSASDYYVLGFYRDLSQARKFMNRGQYDKVRRQWNPPALGIIEFNKWIFGHYCASTGIPTPKCYGLFHPDCGVTADGRPLRGLDDLRSLMAAANGSLAIKPVAGSHGDHVMITTRFDAQSELVTRASGQQMPLAALHQVLLGQRFPWILQERIRQHPALHDLHPSSLNTCRIITLVATEGEVRILGAVLRMGTGSGEVDNTTGGGIAAPIDLDSGVCGAAVSEATIRRAARHPDSGHLIQGFVVPEWPSIQAAAIDAHQRLPFARSLGWDVALGETGPVILEVNGTWYQNHVQMTGRSLWQTAFGKGPA
jgi:hypothetical protein